MLLGTESPIVKAESTLNVFDRTKRGSNVIFKFIEFEPEFSVDTFICTKLRSLGINISAQNKNPF